VKTYKPWTIIITIGSVLAALTATFIFWADWGYVHNKKYTEDHIAVPVAQTVVLAIDRLDKKVTAFNTQWECDETGEELLEKRTELATLATVDLALSVALTFDIENLQATWDELDCKQFSK